MSTVTKDWAEVAETLEALRRELAQLGQRVAALEAGAVRSPMPVAHPAPAHHPAGGPAKPEALNEELILVISAAVAAFLGKRPHIRQIRLLGSAAWSQQGRVTVQASHALQRSQP